MEERVATEIVLQVPPGYADAGRLDRYITGFVMNATRTKVQRAIREGNVRINGRVETKSSYSVAPGDVILCTVMRAPPIRIEPEAIPLDIVFEDDHVIVVNKPAGMVVHPAYGHRSGTLVNALLHHVGGTAIEAHSDEDGEDDGDEQDDDDSIIVGPDARDDVGGLSSVGALSPGGAVRPGIVHRLDKDTSGLMVVAKHDVAHVRLASQFEQRTIHRTYNAIAWGDLPDSGTIDAPIGRSSRDRKKMAVVKGGKPAVTHFKKMRRWKHASMLELNLETGRTHQIRVHLLHVGHAILGDTTYGGDEIRSGPDTRNRRAFFRNVFEGLPRQALHARRLEFVHPHSNEVVAYEVGLPDDFLGAMERLEKDV
jgi:23S rRNA pseudouridine1911/1915/1917 synthase